jgi:hypothetical protein
MADRIDYTPNFGGAAAILQAAANVIAQAEKERLLRLADKTPAAYLVRGDGEAMHAFVTHEQASMWIATERRRGSPYTFTTEPLYTL